MRLHYWPKLHTLLHGSLRSLTSVSSHTWGYTNTKAGVTPRGYIERFTINMLITSEIPTTLFCLLETRVQAFPSAQVAWLELQKRLAGHLTDWSACLCSSTRPNTNTQLYLCPPPAIVTARQDKQHHTWSWHHAYWWLHRKGINCKQLQLTYMTRAKLERYMLQLRNGC